MNKFKRFMIIHLASIMELMKHTFEGMLKWLGPVFVIIGAGLISFAVYVHFTFVLPWFNDGPAFTWSFTSLLHALLSFWLSLGIAWNYGKSVITKPPPPLSFAPSDYNFNQDNFNTPLNKTGDKFCKSCKQKKVARMHHCHVCGRCIPAMDHHCPWIGNCVGSHNHHYFVLFLLYLFLGCCYASSMSFVPFLVASNISLPWVGNTSRAAVVFSFILAVSVALAIFCLMSWQFFLILTGQTSIEFYVNKNKAEDAAELGLRHRNRFDLGIQRNFQVFFGVSGSQWWFAWLVPGMIRPTHEYNMISSSIPGGIVKELDSPV